MQYKGGKFLISKEIVEVINEVQRRKNENIKADCGANRSCGGGTFISLFCGSCAVETKVKGFDKIICNDANKYLIAMWNAAKHGYQFPDSVTYEEWDHARKHKDDDPALSAFYGFGCSFGGNFFISYARSKKCRNFADIAKRSIERDIALLKDATFTCNDYRDVPIPPKSTIYADPPYFGTEGYKFAGSFDTNEFWEYMRKLAKEGNKVYISEMTAPPDFVCIWQKEIQRSISSNKDKKIFATEKLFTYGGA